MTLTCPSCAAELPVGMRFCGFCGTPLPAAPLPRERRLVSVLFCDLVGFTSFSETRDHEDVRDVLAQYFAAARAAIAAYGGAVEKFIGDAVMAVWGAPIAREEDAERAVRAGLDIVAAVSELAEQLALPELQVRVGILTGEAAVDVGARGEGMVIGDAVNTASRIQSLADPGTVLVDDTTRQASERALAYAPAGTHTVKGRSVPVRVWRTLGTVPRRGGPGVIGGIEPPLVGRDAELAALRGAVDGLIEGAHGMGASAVDSPGLAGARLVSVTAEAGLGKSRLARELRAYAGGLAAPVRWLDGRATAFGERTGLGPLAEMVRAACELPLAAERSVQSAHVRTWLGELLGAVGDRRPDDPSAERAAVAVERLFELDDGREPIEPGTLFTAWRHVVELLAARAPVVLCFEELQLAEPALLAFIDHLLDWCREAAVLVLVLARPDPRLDALVARGARITLRPLAPDETDALVAGVLSDPPRALLSQVHADGGGVPLYAVETLRALADRGAIVPDGPRWIVREDLGELTLPPTVRALVASRLDRLDVPERRSLSAGAVLGERFAAAADAALADLGLTDAAAILEGLVDKALLAHERETLYAFLQGVVRRVLLSTLARRDRRRLHLAAAEYLASASGETDVAVRRAGHLLAALELTAEPAAVADLGRAAEAALREAAERAAAVGSLEEAIELLDRAAELQPEEHERARIFERAGAFGQRAGAQELTAERFARAGELHAASGRERERAVARVNELRARRYGRDPTTLVEELTELHHRLDGRPDAAFALAGAVLAFTLYQLDRNAEAAAVAAGAVEVATSCDAPAELIMALNAQASALAELERPEEAIALYRRALELAGGQDRLVSTLSGNLSVALGSLGLLSEAEPVARAAIAAGERAADRVFTRWGHLSLARILCSLGDWDGALAEVGDDLETVPNFQLGMACSVLVVVALGRGDRASAREVVEHYDARSADAGASLFAPDFRALRACVLALDSEDPPASLGRVLPATEAADVAEWSGWIATVVDALVGLGDGDAAGDGTGAALAAAHAALGRPGRLLRTDPICAQRERLAGHLAARTGDNAGARAALERALGHAEAGGMRRDAERIKAEAELVHPSSRPV